MEGGRQIVQIVCWHVKFLGNNWNGWKLDEMQTDTSIKIKVATIVQGTKQKNDEILASAERSVPHYE